MHMNAVEDEQNRIINYIGIVSDLTEHKLPRTAFILFRKL